MPLYFVSQIAIKAEIIGLLVGLDSNLKAKILALKRNKMEGVVFRGVKISESIDFTGLMPIWQVIGMTLPSIRMKE